jgi:3-(3-hydroxy-phenyl)propionate hydroxylase
LGPRRFHLIAAFDPPPRQPYPLGWTPRLMFVQPEFEPILRQGAVRFANVEIFRISDRP